MGYFGQRGVPFVLGRYKSLLIDDDGEKYSPKALKNHLFNIALLLSMYSLQ
jgi:hypothetical protein